VIIEREYQSDTEIMCLILKVLANMARDKLSAAQLMKDTGNFRQVLLLLYV
jgi:hypothetical protein